MDGLVDASKEPFVHCYECPMPFCGSPADMVHHLTDACSGHCWPLAENIKYETCYPFTMPESLEDHRRLVVSEEDGSVFLLIVGGVIPCVKTNDILRILSENSMSTISSKK